MSELIDGRYVVGMTWSSILDGDPEAAARKRATSEKANWYAHGDTEKTFRNVGVAHLPRKLKPAKDVPFLSMARIVAAINPHGYNFYAVALPGDDGRVWICGVAEGIPQPGFDAVYSDIDAPGELEQFLRTLDIDEGQCGVHGDASGLPSSVTHVAWSGLNQAAGLESVASLKPTTVALADILTPQRRAALLLLVLLLGGWVGWSEYSKQKKRRLAAQAVAAAPDPAVEWGRAVDAWQGQLRAPGKGTLSLLRRAMDTVPVNVSGWNLLGLDCKLDAQQWSCAGNYERSKDRLQDANTGGFLRDRPQQWVVTPRSLDVIEVSFRIPVVSEPLRLQELQKVDWHMVNTATSLQRAGRAFTAVSMSPFQAVAIPPPSVPGAGPIPMPPGLATPSISMVKLAGPMRSLDLAEITDMAVTWEIVTIKVNLAGVSPTLTASAVTADAKGTIYARK